MELLFVFFLIVFSLYFTLKFIGRAFARVFSFIGSGVHRLKLSRLAKKEKQITKSAARSLAKAKMMAQRQAALDAAQQRFEQTRKACAPRATKVVASRPDFCQTADQLGVRFVPTGGWDYYDASAYERRSSYGYRRNYKTDASVGAVVPNPFMPSPV
tara:strand:- start:1478 stop:1948 length:471 start_codon:yes stop_codon:yes gene_type:complete